MAHHPLPTFDMMRPVVDYLLDRWPQTRIINPNREARTYEDALRAGAAVRFETDTSVFLDVWPRTGSFMIGGYRLHRGSIQRGNALTFLQPDLALDHLLRQAADNERGVGHDRPFPPLEAYAENFDRM